MSKLGVRWEIGGVPAAFITRGAANGRYCVTFERDTASLEQIEQIDWSSPVIQRLTDQVGEPGLPEGYGFQVADIRYQHASRCFVVEVQTAQQYLGDVTSYQAQIDALSETIAAQQAAMDVQAAQAAALTADMEAAYQEGVESNG